MSTDQDTERIIELAERLADRFEQIGLGEDGKMDAADKRLLRQVRDAIEQYRGEDVCPACHGAKGRIRTCDVCKGTGKRYPLGRS